MPLFPYSPPPQAWGKYLRQEFIIAFKAFTQNSPRLGQAKINLKVEYAVIKTSKCVGADTPVTAGLLLQEQ